MSREICVGNRAQVEVLEALLSDPKTIAAAGMDPLLVKLIAATVERSRRMRVGGQNLVRGIRYDPELIKFAVAVHATSRSAYALMAEVFALPSEGTVTDYQRSVRTTAGDVRLCYLCQSGHC